MYDDILMPTDGSSGTVETIEHAVAIARDNDATLHVLYVLDKRRYRAASKDTKEDVIQSLEVEGERALDDARTRAEDAGLEVVTELHEGVPHRDIVEYAADNDIDMITMGTHGRTGRDRVASLGSVTDRVVQNAQLPVLVVNIGKD